MRPDARGGCELTYSRRAQPSGYDGREIQRLKVLGVSWVGVVSDDADIEWYLEAVLGLPVVSRGPTWTEFSAGPVMVETLAPSSATASHLPSRRLAVALQVESLDAAIRELQAGGGSILGSIQEWRGEGRRHRWAYLDSPPDLPLLLREASDDQG